MRRWSAPQARRLVAAGGAPPVVRCDARRVRWSCVVLVPLWPGSSTSSSHWIGEDGRQARVAGVRGTESASTVALANTSGDEVAAASSALVDNERLIAAAAWRLHLSR